MCPDCENRGIIQAEGQRVRWGRDQNGRCVAVLPGAEITVDTPCQTCNTFDTRFQHSRMIHD